MNESSTEKLRTPNFRRLVIIAVVLIILSTVMVFYARDVIREVVVLPLSYLFWVLGIIVNMTPQIFFWLVVLLISFMIAWRNLAGRKKAVAAAPTVLNELPYDPSSGRTLFWASKVNLLRTGRSGYQELAFHNALIHLLVDLLAYRYRMTTRMIEDHMKAGTLDVPVEVREYVLAHLNRLDTAYPGFFGELWQSLVVAFQGLWAKITANKNAGPAPLDPRVAFILKYMEEELEVSHDESGH